jgi:hypothetical protein
MSKEVEEVPMWKDKRSFDPLFEALFRISGLVPQTTECSTFSVIDPFADVEVQLASFNDGILANSRNPP